VDLIKKVALWFLDSSFNFLVYIIALVVATVIVMSLPFHSDFKALFVFILFFIFIGLYIWIRIVFSKKDG
jgi:hypothetical protein